MSELTQPASNSEELKPQPKNNKPETSCKSLLIPLMVNSETLMIFPRQLKKSFNEIKIPIIRFIITFSDFKNYEHIFFFINIIIVLLFFRFL